MKNRHIIAAALLLLTTTAAAQDRHTETAPDTGENLQTAPNAEQLRQQIETLQRQLDLLEKGQDTLAAKKPALLSDPVEPIANMNGIIPLDTLQTINEAVKIVIYNDNSWKYVRDREFVKDSSIYTKYWDTSTLFPYKEYPLSEMPASLAIDLVDSLKCYHYPHKGSIRSKYGIRYRRRHQGVDIPVKTGDPIYATFDGRVRISEYNRGGYGNLIIVRHDNGLETYYGHLSERLVQSGEWVEAGQIIGLGGSTGRSTGPHLHFETRYYGQAFDPERLIDFESGILRRQTFLLKKSFFDIRSNAGQDFEDEIANEEQDKKEAAELAWKLHDYGYKIYGTPGTARYLNSQMVPCSTVRQMSEERPNVLDLLESGLVDYIISTSPHGRDPHRDSVKFRRKATELSIPCITALDTARILVNALRGDHDISGMELVDIATLHRDAANGKLPRVKQKNNLGQQSPAAVVLRGALLPCFCAVQQMFCGGARALCTRSRKKRGIVASFCEICQFLIFWARFWQNHLILREIFLIIISVLKRGAVTCLMMKYMLREITSYDQITVDYQSCKRYRHFCR